MTNLSPICIYRYIISGYNSKWQNTEHSYEQNLRKGGGIQGRLTFDHRTSRKMPHTAGLRDGVARVVVGVWLMFTYVCIDGLPTAGWN